MLPLLRVLHWGPLIALSIINCVTFTTLHMTSQWLSSQKHIIGLLNYFIYYVLIATTLYNFFCAIFIGPGYVPLKWTPLNSNDCQYLQFCDRCDGFKCPRAHHCRKCERCVLKMDHHCPWINNCCGYRNQYYFTAFLLSAVLGSIHSITLLIMGLYRAFYFNWYFYNDSHEHLVYITMTSLLCSVFSIGLSIGVIIAVGGLLIIQLKIMIRNQTSIEEWIVAKAKNRKRDKEFIYPYNIGLWNNVKQVLFESTDNGITWPVNEHCDQFTLTVEQLLQKQEKRSRSSLYCAIADYNGRWFPLFSYGCRVCITFPISDEPRISINNGDHVVVTRWKTHWLYGEKIRTDSHVVKERERERGWFVRKCAVEVIKPTNNYLINANHDNSSSFVINKSVAKKLN